MEDGPWLDLSSLAVSDYLQELDLRRGVLTRRFRIEDAEGRRTKVAQRRLVSMSDPCLAALECTLVAENWSGTLTVRSGLDGRVTNDGVARYRGLDGRHLSTASASVCDGLLTLGAETTQSRIRVGLAARHRVLLDGAVADVVPLTAGEAGFAAVDLPLRWSPGGRSPWRSSPSLCTSRDPGIGEPGEAAIDEIRRAGDFDDVLARHELAWDHLWVRCDVEIDGPVRASLIVRLHVFHLLQTVSPHSIDLDVGIPARGLHGEAYRGHVFWDEMFVMPFLNLRLPQVARAMLLYRWRRLPRHGRAHGRPAIAGRCSPGRAVRPGGRRSQTCTSTRGRGAGCPTTPTCSGTSAWRSPTTPGGTTRRPATSTSSPSTAPSSSCRSRCTGPTWPPTTRSTTGSTSAE